MYETIEKMTCEELTGAYVVLRDLANIARESKNFKDVENRVYLLQELVRISHQTKLEDMRREFYNRGRNTDVQH